MTIKVFEIRTRKPEGNIVKNVVYKHLKTLKDYQELEKIHYMINLFICQASIQYIIHVLTEKMHNLQVRNYVLFGELAEDLSPEGSLSYSSAGWL